jgi:predicted acyltransferase
MIIVNYGGGGIYYSKYFVWILNNNLNFLPGYWFFEHSPWNGITIADVIFPWY